MNNRYSKTGNSRTARRLFAPRVSAFTLVEVMIVIAVIGVLLMIAVPSFRKIRAESQIREAEGQLELLAQAIKRLQWDTGKWPGGVGRQSTGGYEVWNLATADAGLIKADAGFPDWAGAYIREIPLDPWGKPYFFDQDYRIGGKNYVVVGSFGPNRVGPNAYDADDIYIVLAE